MKVILCFWYLFYQRPCSIPVVLHWNTSGISSFIWVCVDARPWFLKSKFNSDNWKKQNRYESFYAFFLQLFLQLWSHHTSSISFKYQRYQCCFTWVCVVCRQWFLESFIYSVVIFRIRISVKAIFLHFDIYFINYHLSISLVFNSNTSSTSSLYLNLFCLWWCFFNQSLNVVIFTNMLSMKLFLCILVSFYH